MLRNEEMQNRIQGTSPFGSFSGDVGKKPGIFQIVLLLLSLAVLSLSLLEAFFNIKCKEIDIFCYIATYPFIGNALWKLYKAENKWKHMRTGWLDFIVSVPWPIGWHAISTVAQNFRCVKQVMEFSMRWVVGALPSMLAVAVSLVLFATASIVPLEKNVEGSNIHNGRDAMWWSFVTITTVGYGDKFPVTNGGRCVAVVLMLGGIGLLGSLVGYSSSIFTDKEKALNDKIDTLEELGEELKKVHCALEKIHENTNDDSKGTNS
jgi:voltage-gated potassium channel